LRCRSRPVVTAVVAVAVGVGLAGCTAEPDGGELDAETTITAEPRQAVPPLLDAIDGWPETAVTLAADPPVTFVVKVADQPDRRRQGLMHVPELPDGVGMLFLFEELRGGGFWMKDTLVPLDIAYLADGEVVAILQMDPCEADPCPSYDPGVAYDAALEVGQGELAAAGVSTGTPATWPEPTEVEAP
jgi:uncharacterized membrane protein (UPF0127 family)